jgi:hypothetical protein
MVGTSLTNQPELHAIEFFEHRSPRNLFKKKREKESRMALTGELSDLSLAELIELFCNRRKTGRLKVLYSIGTGCFYLHAGAVVHAQIGVLKGIEAVYCALTLPNASFTFDQTLEAPDQTITAPWTSVVLEGLRRIDEGVAPPNPFPDEDRSRGEELDAAEAVVSKNDNKEAIWDDRRELKSTLIPLSVSKPTEMPAFLAHAANESSWGNKPWPLGAVIIAVVLLLAVIGVPWGMYARSKAAKLAENTRTMPATNAKTSGPIVPTIETSAVPSPTATDK